MAFDSARSMKKVLRFLWGLLINVCILFVLVKAFSGSFDFAYQVFATTAYDVADTSKATVQIDTDETVLDVAKSLEKAEVIENKYAFILKLRIEGSASKIVAGTYQISPSDTNSDIIALITGASSDTESADSSDGDSAVTAGSNSVNNTGSEGDADSANEAGTGSGVTGSDGTDSSETTSEEDTSAANGETGGE